MLYLSIAPFKEFVKNSRVGVFTHKSIAKIS